MSENSNDSVPIFDPDIFYGLHAQESPVGEAEPDKEMTPESNAGTVLSKSDRKKIAAVEEMEGNVSMIYLYWAQKQRKAR